MTDQTKEVAIVTGASGGIGAAVAGPLTSGPFIRWTTKTVGGSFSESLP